MPNKKSIRQVITRQTLPTLIALAFFSTVVLHAGIFFMVNADVKHRHGERVEKIIERYQTAIDEQDTLLAGIAENPFVIDALEKDTTLSKHILSNYLKSVQFGVLKSAKIKVVNTRGQVVAHNQMLSTEQPIRYEQRPWFNPVFVQQENYYQPSIQGVTFAQPITSTNLVIGALVVEFATLDPFLVFNFEESVILISNPSQQVLYSSDQTEFANFSMIDWQNLGSWRLAYQEKFDDLTFTGIQSNHLYYKEIFRLISFALIALAFIFVSSFISAKAAGKLAASTIEHFIESLQHIRKQQTEQGEKFKLPYTEATELQRLSSEFQHLLKSVNDSKLSKQRVSGLMNSLNDLLVSVDNQGNIDLTNKSFDSFINSIGIQPNKALETIFFSVSADKLLDINEPFSTREKRYLVKSLNTDKPYRTIHWSRHPITDDQDTIIGMTFVGMDTTRSSALETEIHLKEAAFDGADSGILIMDIEDDILKITYANKGAEKLTGISQQEMFDMKGDFTAYTEGNEIAFKNILTATRLGEPVVEILRSKKRDNSDYHLEITMSPVTLPFEKDKKYYLGILKDVTEQQLTAQLLIEAKQKAEESTQMKSSFLASMSHEIRTPMNGVMGMLEFLKESNLDAQQHNYISIAQNSAESLLSIINDILDFSKVEAGKLEIESTDFYLTDMLDGFINSMAHQAHSKRLELILDASAIGQQVVIGDPGRLRQIMTNLVSNAIKFTERGEIVIRAGLSETLDKKYLLNMTIKDTGIGIPHEKQARLFDPFTQVDGAHNRERQGTGLGLAIVKQLCEAMNGHVWINSQPGKGSTFGFRIQLLPSKNAAPALPTLNAQDEQILIVDNNATNAAVLKKQLEKWHVNAEICLSADEAIHFLSTSEEHFTGLFVDMNMPKTDGLVFAQQVKTLPNYRTAKMILMTSISQIGDAQKYKDLGFAGCFAKPVNSHDIIESLQILFNPELDEQSKVEPLIDPLAEPSMGKIPVTDTPLNGNYRILLVEDNPVNQMISKKHIEKLGLVSTIAPDGAQAIQILLDSKEPFDLILMDCQMPILDGFATTRKIRIGEAGDRYLNIPIVAMTANAMMGDRDHCLEVGMDDYISKPLRKDILLSTLKNWLTQL